MKKVKIYKVREDALTSPRFGETNRRIVDENGYLFLLDNHYAQVFRREPNSSVVATAMANGSKHVFLVKELEASE